MTPEEVVSMMKRPQDCLKALARHPDCLRRALNQDPEMAGKLWGRILVLKNSERARAIQLFGELISRLDKTVIRVLARGTVDGTLPGETGADFLKLLPGSAIVPFYRGLVGSGALTMDFITRLVGENINLSPYLLELDGVVREQPNNQEAIDRLSDLYLVFGFCLIAERFPIPKPENGNFFLVKGRIANLRPTPQKVSDPKGDLVNKEPVEVHCDADCAAAICNCVQALCDTYMMPQHCVDFIATFNNEEHLLRGQISETWKRIVCRAESTGGLWPLTKADVRVHVTINGCDEQETGLVGLGFRAQEQFPGITGQVLYDIWGALLARNFTLDRETGLADDLNEFEGTSLTLRLLLNRELVLALEDYVFTRRAHEREKRGISEIDSRTGAKAHWVRPHGRFVPKLSDEAREAAEALAAERGIVLLPGKTFVHEHHRGQGEPPEIATVITRHLGDITRA